MATREPIGKELGSILFLAVVAMLTTTVHADCYRYISGDGANPHIRQECVEQLGVMPIFVRLTETGYDLLIPATTETTTETSYRRAAAASTWLAEGSNLASTQAAVEDMLLNGAWPRPVPMYEQLNYNLATWLNTTGASASISSFANDATFAPSNICHVPGRCTSCKNYICLIDWTVRRSDALCCPA